MKKKIPFESMVSDRLTDNIRFFEGVTQHSLSLNERIAWAKSPGMSELVLSGCGHYERAYGHRWERKGLDEAVYIYCVAGKGYYRQASNAFEINKGDLLYCYPRSHQEYWADGENPWTIYWIHLFGKQTSLFERKIGFTKDKPVRHIGIHNDVMDSFQEIFSLFKEDLDDTSRFAVQGCIYRLMGLFARHTHRPSKEELWPHEVTAVVEFMKRSLDQKLSVEDLSEYAGLSPFYFSRLFRKYTGYTLINYFNQLKIRKAGTLLAGSSLKVKEVASQLGYSDPYYFSRLFRKTTGNSPEQYRALRVM